MRVEDIRKRRETGRRRGEKRPKRKEKVKEKRGRGGSGVVFLLVTRNSVLPLRGIRWLSLHPLWTFHLPRARVTPLQPTSNPPTTLTRQISLASWTSPNWYESSLSTSFLPFYGKWRAESRERRSHLREKQRKIFFFRKALEGTRAMRMSRCFFLHPFHTETLRAFISKTRLRNFSSFFSSLHSLYDFCTRSFLGNARGAIFLPFFALTTLSTFFDATRFEEVIINKGSTSAAHLYDNPFHAGGLENYHSAHANANNL